MENTEHHPLPVSETPAVERAAAWWAAIPYPGAVVGIAIFVALVAYNGVGQVAATLAVAGWGLPILAAYHWTSLLADAIGWRELVGDRERPSVASFALARWIGEAVNALLPVMQLGGNVVRAHLVSRRGVRGAVAGASVVVDMTLEVLTQFVFTLLGVAMLVADTSSHRLVGPILLGALLMALPVAGFVWAQRAGFLSAAVRAIGRASGSSRWTALEPDAAQIDARITALYADRRALWSGSAWHLAGWVLGAGEVWLALFLLGHRVGLAGAFILESLGTAVRAAAFAVPGALGVQEAGFIVLGRALGIGPQIAIALSLSKRAREILLGVPGLLVWQIAGKPAKDTGSSAKNRP